MDLNPSPDRPNTIQNMFDELAKTYDKANDVITFGMAHKWRRNLVEMSGAREGHWVLDCATGTGDMAFEFKRAVGSTGTVIGVDFSKEMLVHARNKTSRLNLDVRFEQTDISHMNYPSEHFDITSVAYGIRNVANPSKVLREMARVTKPGGKVMVLETGELPKSWNKKIIEFYCSKIVPVLGGIVSGKKDAYEYLQKSSSAFPSKDAFCDLMLQTGAFVKVDFKMIMNGASYVYEGIVR
jgi:demethylmenaquinone methyltransferase/2-methoxy-6-polyprenyl-1,4-benzoquinol methylase